MEFQHLDFTKVKFYSIKDRKSKVRVEDFARCEVTGSFSDFFSSIPTILAGKDLKEIVNILTTARNNGEPIIFSFGAHIVKCGVSPCLIELMKSGFFSLLATNGAGIIHDLEIAFFGHTSEFVSENIKDGSFGMARELPQLINPLVTGKEGLGEELKKVFQVFSPSYKEKSLLYWAYKLKIPFTVHIAIGSDILHLHPSFDPAKTAEASFKDFKLLIEAISSLESKGVIWNVGSAVILPTVIEKAISLARNLGAEVSGFTGITFDFLNNYRSNLCPPQRARELGGRGYYIIGHHEILIPLITWALLI